MIQTSSTDDLSLVIGRDIQLERELARGGEGRIFTIVDDPDHVAKVFHKPTVEKAAKLNAMLANPPRDHTREALNHISIAWPTARLLDRQGRYIGFIMPYIDPSESFPLLKVYNPQDRLRANAAFTWEYLLRMAINLTSVVKELHSKGYVVGDLNESNVLVTTTALVTMVDCDSIQVPKKRRWLPLRLLLQLLEWLWILPLVRLAGILPQPKVFRCTVGKPEYTPPELQGCNFSQVNREAKHDNFSLAILIFLMLMEGRHPFAGIWRGGGKPHTLLQNIRAGDFPYVDSNKIVPPTGALPFDILPYALQDLMIRCFVTSYHWPGYLGRPGASAWYRALEKAERQLKHCSVNHSHVYGQHLDYCPWCERAKLGIDPFPALMAATRQKLTLRRMFTRALALVLLPLTGALYFEGIRSRAYYAQYLNPIPVQIHWLIVVLLLILPAILCLRLVRKFWRS